MSNPYLHECCICEEVLDELDNEIIRDDEDREWYCIPCWRVMDAKRDAEYEQGEAA